MEQTERELPAERHQAKEVGVADGAALRSEATTSTQLAALCQRKYGHPASGSRGDELLRRHGARFASFSVIGGGIFVAGLLLQAGLTSGLHVSSLASYIVQAVASVEGSYFLNRWFTWRAARTPLWSSFLRYNLQKAVTVTANLTLYGVLLKLGVEYLLDNVLLTVLFTFVNYIGADKLVFLRGSRQMVGAVTEPPPVITGPMPDLHVNKLSTPKSRGAGRELPSISVVIPVRANEKTIRAAIDSILSQDYLMLRELILVGSPGDSTWSALQDVDDPRLSIMETQTPPGIRDANFKRDLGIRRTSGELISLIDSDMVIPQGWMSDAVRLLMESEVDCVSGVMRSIRDDFWGRFVDRNQLSAKTPRAKAAYLVTAEAFGATGHKPPITANILFRRAMYEDCPIDSSWSHGSLEDYEWFWRAVQRGHCVLVSNQLFGWHHHRGGIVELAREYRRSARGCAYFIQAHRNSPFARKRMAQAVALPLSVLVVLVGLTVAVCLGKGLATAEAVAALCVTGVAILSALEFARTRTLESLLYPLPALVLGINYTTSLVTHLIRNIRMQAVAPPVSSDQGLSTGYRIRNLTLTGLRQPLTLILAVQAGLTLSLIWSNTAFGDEADYIFVGTTLIHHALHGTPWPTTYAHTTLSGLPFIYPPLAAIANMLGGLAGARILSLLFMLCATIFVYLVSRHLFGRTCAITSAALVAVFSPNIQLGAFATYDAMSVALTACAAWLAVQASYRRHQGELVAASAIALALEALTAYSGTVMMPIVVIFSFLVWRDTMGWKRATFCTGWLTAAALVVFALILTVSKTWSGIFFTVFARTSSTKLSNATSYASVGHVFNDSWTYSGVIAVLAAIAVIYAFSSRQESRSLLIAYLAVVTLVIPLAQAHDSTAVSLKKHLAYGGLFAAMAAGYGISQLVRTQPTQRFAALACCAVAFIFPAVNGIESAQSWFQSWPNESSVLSNLKPLLAGDPDVTVALGGDANFMCPYYYAPNGSSWENCHTILTLTDVASAVPKFIILGYPASVTPPSALPLNLLLSPDASQSQFMVALSQLADGSKVQNSKLLSTFTEILRTGGRYRLVASGPYDSNQSSGLYTIWERSVAPASAVKAHIVKAHIAVKRRTV